MTGAKHRAWVEVDLDALVSNMHETLQGADVSSVMPVVKAEMTIYGTPLFRRIPPKGNATNPGMMATEMTAATLAANESKYLARIPLRRIADAKEIADVIVFLASEQASYMTGATMDVSGGMLMR